MRMKDFNFPEEIRISLLPRGDAKCSWGRGGGRECCEPPPPPSMTSFWCFYCYFTPISRVSIGDFEQVNVSWVIRL